MSDLTAGSGIGGQAGLPEGKGRVGSGVPLPSSSGSRVRSRPEAGSPEDLFSRLLWAQTVSLGLSLAMIVCLIQSVVRVIDPPRPHITYTSGHGEEYPVYPLREPVLAGSWVTQWAEAAVLQAYAVDFAAYNSEFYNASRRFTRRGWLSFRHSFIVTGDFEKLVQGRLVGSAQAQAPPVVMAVDHMDGRYAWHIQFPLVATYQNGNDRVPEQLMVDVTVVRVPIADHPDGMAIDRIEATPQ